ncbi:MAG: DEAD/DEAH box helicase, partial [Kofleriaceae bacterium]|nr:DEAD/DEAH box helicase [Kofleriaceae bacterium]
MSELSVRVERVRDRLVDFLSAGDDADPILLRGKGRSPSLLKLCERVLTKVEEKQQPSWQAWSYALDGLHLAELDQQMACVARGLMLCQMVVGRRTQASFTPISDSPLHQSTESLKGIGPKMSASLAEHGIESVEDLLWLIPRRYDDVRDVLELEQVVKAPPIGERVVLVGDIETVRFARRGPRGWIDMRLVCGSGKLVVRWFNARAGMCSRYEEGGRAVLAGKLSERGGILEMGNPDVLALTSADGVEKVLVEGVVPRYSAIPGVPPSTLRKACQAAAIRASSLISEAVPQALAEELKMVSLAQALSLLHEPSESMSSEEVVRLNQGESEWHRRLAFEELFVLAMVVAKRRLHARADLAHGYSAQTIKQAGCALPFDFTGAQKRVVREIASDIAEEVPMNRLLQGDVGAGKTAVAFAAAQQVAAGGAQVALMAPTTILAEQHFRSLSSWCEKVGIRVALLTAGTAKGVRASTLSLLAAGEIDLLIGTHALIAEAVVFRELGL